MFGRTIMPFEETPEWREFQERYGLYDNSSWSEFFQKIAVTIMKLEKRIEELEKKT